MKSPVLVILLKVARLCLRPPSFCARNAYPGRVLAFVDETPLGPGDYLYKPLALGDHADMRLPPKPALGIRGSLWVIGAALLAVAPVLPVAHAQQPGTPTEEVVANLAAGRVVIAVVKDAILVGTVENPIEAGRTLRFRFPSRPIASASYSARSIGSRRRRIRNSRGSIRSFLTFAAI